MQRPSGMPPFIYQHLPRFSPLALQLDKLSHAQSRVWRRLFSFPCDFELDICDETAHCNFLFTKSDPLSRTDANKGAPAAHDFAYLRNNEFQLFVQMLSSPHSDNNETKPWWCYEGAARSLAWSIDYQDTISVLESIFGCRFAPAEVTAYSSAHEAEFQNWLHLTFTIRVNGRAHQGKVILPDKTANKLASAASMLGRRSQSAFRHLSVGIGFETSMGKFDVRECNEIRPGDVLLTSFRGRQELKYRICVNGITQDWEASSHENGIRLDTISKFDMTGKAKMKLDQNGSSGPSELGFMQKKKLSSLSQLPVELSLQVGQLQITLGELENLQPGYVFPMSSQNDELTLTVLVNQQPAGLGELVSIGNQLGVRITEWFPNGL
ncbi:Type III secretion pathway protein [gamma proteobacterium HdN1]|nr:Type III secretion pathway protein [gamma proteobacterium HdN1]